MAGRVEGFTLASAVNEGAQEPDPTAVPRSGTAFTGDAPRTMPGGAGGGSGGGAGSDGNGDPQVPVLDTERFVVLRAIGRGGSGVVVRAFDKDILREVAIKILTPDAPEGGLDVVRFTEEARITGQLEHPNIVPVYEYGVDRGGQRFLCMKLVEGKTLEGVLTSLGASRLDPEHLADLLQVFVKVCEAVSYAHSRGVIHRDLKPTNIMMSEFGQVYVLDWGIARRVLPSPRYDSIRTQNELDPPGAFIGTAQYMAPEQIQGRHDDLDQRTDVFALGGTLYQILTGRPPLTPEIMGAVWQRKVPPPIPPARDFVTSPSIPAEIERIALKALSFDPAERHASVLDLKRDVELFQRGSWDLPRRAVTAGTVVVTEGGPGHEAFVIVEGECVAYRMDGDEEVQLRTMGPGEVFGETAVFSDKPRSASVKASTDVVLLVVTSEALSNAVGLHSWMGAFVRSLAHRFRDVDEKLRSAEQTLRHSTPPPVVG
jgi:serine/threonine-protein kinase